MYWACIFSLSSRFTLRSISMRQLQKERSWLRHGSDGLHVQSKHQASSIKQHPNRKKQVQKAKRQRQHATHAQTKTHMHPVFACNYTFVRLGENWWPSPPVTAIGTLGPQHELGRRYLSNCNNCLITNINRHDGDMYYWPSRRIRRECSCIHAGPWCLHSSSWLWLLTSCDVWYVDLMNMKTAPCVRHPLDFVEEWIRHVRTLAFCFLFVSSRPPCIILRIFHRIRALCAWCCIVSQSSSWFTLCRGAPLSLRISHLVGLISHLTTHAIPFCAFTLRKPTERFFCMLFLQKVLATPSHRFFRTFIISS